MRCHCLPRSEGDVRISFHDGIHDDFFSPSGSAGHGSGLPKNSSKNTTQEVVEVIESSFNMDENSIGVKVKDFGNSQNTLYELQKRYYQLHYAYEYD